MDRICSISGGSGSSSVEDNLLDIEAPPDSPSDVEKQEILPPSDAPVPATNNISNVLIPTSVVPESSVLPASKEILETSNLNSGIFSTKLFGDMSDKHKRNDQLDFDIGKKSTFFLDYKTVS